MIDDINIYVRNPMKDLIASPIAFEAVCSYLGA